MNLFRRQEKKKTLAAFTMMEMLVSISVIMIISIIFIANYRNTNKRTDLIMTSQMTVADFRFAQNNSLGLVKYNASVPAGGWGIHINTNDNSYTIFADLDAPETPGYMRYDASTEGVYDYGARKTSFGENMVIESLSIYNGSLWLPATQANITFLPPDPQTNIFNPDTDLEGRLIEIEIKDLRGGDIKKIQINFLGLIEVVE